MSQQTNNNNATASQIGMGIGGILSGIGNNLWAAKERRRSQEWQQKMLNQTTAFSREDATTAYNRDMDYSTRMNNMRAAGINPFMVAGSSYSAPVARGGGSSPGPMAPGNFDFIAQIPLQVMQMKMMQAQIDNIKAEEATKIADLPIKEQTAKNLSAAFDLIKNDTKGSELKNLLLSIQGQTEKGLRNAELAQLEENTRYTKQNRLNAVKQGSFIESQIKNNAALTELARATIELRKQDLETGKLTQQQIANEIVTEAYKRQYIDAQTYKVLLDGSNTNANTDFQSGENKRREEINERDGIKWLKDMAPTPGKNGWFKF